MNSPFANIFLAIQARIQNAVPAILYIDQELGQLSNTRPPVSWPCVLIDFEDFDFSGLAENVQTATGTVVLRLGFAPHSPSSSGTPVECIEQALLYYDIEWMLHKAIQGWRSGDAYGSMSRINAGTQKRSDSYRVREIRYSIAFEDYSTKRTLTYVPAEVVIADVISV